MANDKKKIEIEIQGNASSLEKATKSGLDAVNQLNDGVNTLGDDLSQTANAVNETNNRFTELKDKLQGIVSSGFSGFVDHALIGLTALAAKTVIWGLEAKEAFKLEKGFADANRMFDESSANIQTLDNDLKDLSTKKLDIPVEEIQHLAKVAGGMGKTADEVKDFIQTSAEAALSFNMPAEEMMTRLGGIQAAIGLTNKQLPEFTDKVKIAADSIGGMTTEADIMAVLADGVAQAGKEFGLLSGETVAYASTLLSTGTIVSDASGSLFNLFFSLKNINGQNKEFKDTLDSLGLSANQFAADIKANPVAAINGLLAKLGELQGERKIGAITGLVGGNTTRQAAMLNLVNNLDTVKNQLNNTADAQLYAGKVHEAYEKKLDTGSAKLHMMQNALSIMAAAFIDPFLPAIKLGIDGITSFSDWMRKGAENHPYLEILFKTIQLFLGLAGAIHIVRWLFMPFLAVLGLSIVSAFQLATGLRAILNMSLAEFFVSATASLRSFVATQIAANTGFATMLASSRAFFVATVGRVAQLTTALWAMFTAQVASSAGFSAMLVSARAFVVAAIASIGQVVASLWGMVTAQIAINFSFAASLGAVRAFAVGAIASIAALSTRLVALATAGLSFSAIWSAIATGARGVAASFATLGAAASTLAGVFKFLVGSLTGLALTFLAIAIVFASDKMIEFGGVTAKVGEFFSAAWEVAARQVKGTFNSLFDDVGKKSKDTATAAYSPWDNFFTSITDSVYNFANHFILAFDLIGKAIGTLLAGGGLDDFLQNFNAKRDYLGEFKTAITTQVKADQTTPKPEGGETRKTDSDTSALQNNGADSEVAKKHIKQLDDLQQQAFKNQQDRLKSQRDYDLDALAVVLKESILNVKKLELSKEEEAARLSALAKEQADAEIAIKRDFILKEQKLNAEAIQAKIKAAKDEAAALAKPDGKSLAGLIAGGESGKQGYNAYNKGTDSNKKPIPADKPIDLTALTIAEIQARQALDKGNAERLGAVGKYQLIAGTLKEAVAGLRLTADTKFDAATQEKLFVYLLAEKRPSIKQYITGKSQDLAGVQANAALEFASIADPKTGQSHYPGNKASINTQQFQSTINSARAAYQQNKATGMDDKPAYSQAISGGGLEVEAQAELNNKLAALDLERVANRDQSLAELKKLGLDERTALTEQGESQLELAQHANEREKALLAERQQAQHNADSAAIAAKQVALQQQADLGQISQQEVLAGQKKLAAEQLVIDLKLAGQRLAITKKGTVERAQAEEQILQLRRDAAATEIGIDNKVMLERKRLFDGLFDPLLSAFEQMTNGVMTGQQTLSNALRNMAQSITVSYLQESLKQRAIKVRDWAFDKLGMADVLAEKKQLDVLELAWDGLMWIRKRIRKTVEWAFDISGFAGVEAKKKAIKTAGALWDGILWAKKKVLLAAEWAWDMLGFGAKEAAKTETKIVAEGAQTGAQVLGDTIRAESSVAAAGTSKAATADTAKSSIMDKAYDAAAGAYNAIVGIPYVGPFLAPIAAAVAFVGVSAFGALVGSAKGGEWEVGKDGSPYVLHEKESVLPAGVADNFRKVVGFAKKMTNPEALLDRFNPDFTPEALNYMRTVKLTPLPPAPPAIMQFVAQQRAANTEIQEKAAIKEQIQAEMRRITLEMAAKNNRRTRDDLRIHTIGVEELFKGRGGEAMVKELARQHRNFRRIKL